MSRPEASDRMTAALSRWVEDEVDRIRSHYPLLVAVDGCAPPAPDGVLIRIHDPEGRGSAGAIWLYEVNESDGDVFLHVLLSVLRPRQAAPRWRDVLGDAEALVGQTGILVRRRDFPWRPLRADEPPAMRVGIERLIGRDYVEDRRLRRRLIPYGGVVR